MSTNSDDNDTADIDLMIKDFLNPDDDDILLGAIDIEAAIATASNPMDNYPGQKQKSEKEMDSNEQEEMFIICEVCNLAFTSIKTYEQHVKGMKHKRQVEDQKTKMQVKSVDDDSCLEKTKDSEAQDYTCLLCKMEFTGIIPYTQHLKSKHHAKVIRRKKAEDDLALLENDDSDSELLDDDANLNEMAKKILPEPYGSCSLCEKQFTGPEPYSQHIKSKTHEKRKFELQLLKKLKAVLSICEVSDSEEICEDKKEEKGLEAAEKLKCKVCDKVFPRCLSFAQHLISKAHKKRGNQKKLLEDLKTVNMMQIEDDSSSSEDEESSETLTCEICGLAFSGPENLEAHINSKKHKKAVKWKKYLAKKDKSIEETTGTQTNLENKVEREKPSGEKEINCPAKSESSSEVVKGDESQSTED